MSEAAEAAGRQLPLARLYRPAGLVLAGAAVVSAVSAVPGLDLPAGALLGAAALMALIAALLLLVLGRRSGEEQVVSSTLEAAESTQSESNVDADVDAELNDNADEDQDQDQDAAVSAAPPVPTPGPATSDLLTIAPVLAHEIRNPLTAAVGRLDLMIDDPALTLDQQNSLRTVLRGVERSSALISDFLADPEGWRPGGTIFDREPVELGALVQDAMQEYSPLANERQVSMSLDVQGDLTLHGDSRGLRQLVDNLLSNAVKYNDQHGWIDIRITAAPDAEGLATEILLEITNPGTTLTPEEDASAFTPHFRGEGLPESIPGHGLGLSVVSAIVDAHHGNITMTSDEVSHATKIAVRLPSSLGKSQ